MSIGERSGKVITFYSYKGGTGRSMALANLAWVLASNGLDVLVVDWDLEAPGLHRFFRPFLVDPELRSSPGLIDYVWDVAKKKVTPLADGEPASAADFPSLEDYVVGLNWDFEDKGSIALLPAGRQDENYPQRVNTFDWDDFYARLGGGKLLEAARDALRLDYDYILLDSRTGVSDTSGICTVQLPDLLVVCFTLNHQSIRGAAAVAASIQAQREATFRIYPVPTRLENAETDKLKLAFDFARQTFAPFLIHAQTDRTDIRLDQQTKYWNDVRTPYRTFYAFEEVPAAFKDEPGSHDTILASIERLASHLTGGDVDALQLPKEDKREAVVASYALANEKPLAIEPRDGSGNALDQLRGWDDTVRLAVTRGPGLYPTLRAVVTIATALLIILVLLFQSATQTARSATDAAALAQMETERQRQRADELQAKLTSVPETPLQTALDHPANRNYRIFLHFRPKNQVSAQFVLTARQLLLNARFELRTDTPDSLTASRGTSAQTVGPLVEYLDNPAVQNTASDEARAAAERIAVILNSKLPSEFSAFRTRSRPPNPRDRSNQSEFIAVWF